MTGWGLARYKLSVDPRACYTIVTNVSRKGHRRGNVPESTSQVQECIQFEIDSGNEGAEINSNFGLAETKGVKVQLHKRQSRASEDPPCLSLAVVHPVALDFHHECRCTYERKHSMLMSSNTSVIKVNFGLRFRTKSGPKYSYPKRHTWGP